MHYRKCWIAIELLDRIENAICKEYGLIARFRRISWAHHAHINKIKQFLGWSSWNEQHHISSNQSRAWSKASYENSCLSGLKARKLVAEEVDSIWKLNIVEAANSKRASLAFIVSMHHGSYRKCIEYRKLDTVTTRDAFSFPRMDECIHFLWDATKFSTFGC